MLTAGVEHRTCTNRS